LFNNFRTNEDFSQLEGTKKLDWKRWNPLMSLDTIERYKFLYPKDGLYQFTFSRTDTAFAEVSPFLVDSMGNLLPVNILYIDNDPVYLSVTTNPKPYVFRVDNGWHSLTIRITAKEIVFHKIFLKKGTKTILSINPFIVNSQFSVRNTTPWYTFNEQNLIRNSVIAVRHNYWNSFAVLNQGANYELLTGGNNYGNYVVGPYKPAYFKFQKFGAYAVNTYFEPGFEYEFQPDLVKMRCWGILNGYKNYTEHKTPAQAFNDSVYTYEDIQVLWQKEVNKELSVKPGYNNPNYTARGNCVLQVNYQPKENFYDLQPKNLLVFSNSDPDFIRIYPGTEKVIHNLIPGTYRIETLLFGNSIIITDSVEVKPNGTNYCRYNESNVKTRNAYTDSISLIIQRRLFYNEVNVKYVENYREEQEKIKELAKRSRTITYNGGHILRGKISDASTSEPLPGVNIIIDGTTTGTVTNIDGEFELSVPSGSYAVSVSFIGYVTERFEFNQGANINVQLLPDVMKLEEIVVVGYGTQKKSDITGSIVNMSSALQGKVAGVSAGAVPDIRIRGISSIEGNSNMLIVIDGIPQEGSFNLLNNEDIANMQVLKDASAVSIYGSRAANGVIIVSTKRKSTLSLLPNILQNKAFMEGVSQSKTLRNRFSDYAFWKPDLTTNNNGIASFEVTFPDDITSWKTYYLAMGMKGASGQAESEIKSFKPIMSSLAVPRFLLAGDRSNILGKALNYTQDSIQVKSTFRMNDSTIYQKDGKILASRIDTFTLSPTTADSVKIQYQILKNDGYSDGELRYIPVFPLGTTETNGNFYNLESDTTITIPFDKSLGTVTLHAEADIINVMLEEMSHLRNYSHLCNEQLSSKLKAVLWERRIFSSMHKEYKYDRDIRKMVKLLEERRNADSLWSWWQKGQTAWWITLHATEALQMAQKDSFKTSVNFKPAMPHLYKHYNSMNYRDQMRVVKLMKAIDTVPDYKQLIDSIKISRYDTVGRYELWELKQSCGLKFPLDSLKHEQKSTQFGNLYWGTESYSLFDDAVSATIVAYRILRNENPKSRELSKIRNYLLERKGNMHWQNTWETCRILETILPDLIKNHELDLKPTLHFSGAYENKIDSFPFHQELKPDGPIYVTKKSNAPVYFTAYQQFFNPAPEPVNKDFHVTSDFENHDTILKAGKPVKLIVNVSVKKASEYVMIEIPIPAGCSYQDKSNFVWGEDYREYFKEKVCIYCSRLAQKNYTFEVNLLPRYNGVYHLNPAKAELMYFPVFFGREGMKTIQIK
jgi:TonB-dependent SusC/RagA subfamily outer membrane receptor